MARTGCQRVRLDVAAPVDDAEVLRWRRDVVAVVAGNADGRRRGPAWRQRRSTKLDLVRLTASRTAASGGAARWRAGVGVV